MIKEIHGIAGAGKVSSSSNDDTQHVTVRDGNTDSVVLSLSANAYPASLTPEQAEFIAGQLMDSARRIKARAVISKK